MKRFLFLHCIFLSTFCFCQEFGVKQKEELAFLSLKSCGFVTRAMKSMPVTYVLVDTVDLPLQNFIKEKFPKKDWRFFDMEECQVIFKKIGKKDLVSGFHLSSWHFKGSYYFDFAFCCFSRSSYADDSNQVRPLVFCGDSPTGRLRYNEEKKEWEFAAQDQLYRKNDHAIKEPDRSHCLPTDDNAIFF